MYFCAEVDRAPFLSKGPHKRSGMSTPDNKRFAFTSALGLVGPVLGGVGAKQTQIRNGSESQLRAGIPSDHDANTRSLLLSNSHYPPAELRKPTP
jgi:hypothetical protein